VPLPVISLSWRSSLAPHHITQPSKNFNILLFVNSVTFWCVLMVNKAFVIKEHCQHHFHLALNLVCHFWPQRLSSLPLWWLDFCCWVIPVDPRFITSGYCLHEVCVLISILLQISGCCKASLFLLDCQQLGINYIVSFMPKSCVRKDCIKPNESPNSSESCLVVILQLSRMAECTLSIISSCLLGDCLNVHLCQLTSIPLWIV